MTSYFYHIAFDIHTPLPPDSGLLSPNPEHFQIPFKAKRKRRPFPPSPRVSSSLHEPLASQQTGTLPREPHSLGKSNSDQRPLARPLSDHGAYVSSPLHVIPDWRYDRIFMQIIDMAHDAAITTQEGQREGGGQITNGIAVGPGGSATKGRFQPLCLEEEEELGWGIIRLYRDNEATPGLYNDTSVGKGSKSGRTRTHQENRHESPFHDEDCTTLCILAVPSYLTPSDFLGFVGEKTRDEVSHFRMIRTERSNRYMVLMKFRSGRRAREWRKEWNGKAFDGIEVNHDHPYAHIENPN